MLWATRHPIDGSVSGMRRLAGLLVPLLALPVDAGEDDVTTAWHHHVESARLSRVMKWLGASRADPVERGVFRPGAPLAALDRLETLLGITLPAAVRFVLERVDGGSFDDDRPPADPTVRFTCCHLLSTEEIEAASFDLIALNDASTQVERWEGKRPVHPRLRRADGTLVPWPYLPIAGTSEGDVLVVELVGPGRVLDAWHEVGPSSWGVVCERYVDFVEQFFHEGGCIETGGPSSNGAGRGTGASR